MVVKIISRRGEKTLGESIYLSRIIGIEQLYDNHILEKQRDVLNDIRKIYKYIEDNNLKEWYVQRLVGKIYMARGYPIVLKVMLDNGMQISFRLRKSINLDEIAEKIFTCTGKLELIIDEDESKVEVRCHEYKAYTHH